MTAPYRDGELPCECPCHRGWSHRVNWPKAGRWLAIVGAPFGLYLALSSFRSCVEWDDAREQMQLERSSLAWKESHEPCRETSTMIGPHTGQPDDVRCRKDQLAYQTVVGDGVVVTCQCVAPRTIE
jgi:hypothetical protein